MEVPPGMLLLGAPAKAVRELKPAERDNIAAQVAELREKAQAYLAQGA
jgi:carbonic anhydrase/acetyltransferase-like protein (isoleucine patch superfamily)